MALSRRALSANAKAYRLLNATHEAALRAALAGLPKASLFDSKLMITPAEEFLRNHYLRKAARAANENNRNAKRDLDGRF